MEGRAMASVAPTLLLRSSLSASQATDPIEKTYPGPGIGLYISNEIITRHHGRLWVESQKGKGSTFYFTLPLHKPQ
jgi:signal transduction histidine kinase